MEIMDEPMTSVHKRQDAKMMKVAVIGAGAAGLAAIRQLACRPHFSAIAFEMTDKVGGTWVYNENTGLDQNGLPIQSSIYANLRTNLPKEVMAFPDLPFRDSPTSFISHEKVLEYLEDYAHHFQLPQYIRFNTLVEKVKPIASELGTKWQIQVRDLKTKMPSEVIEVDGVIVANGHYAIPLLPDLPGLKSFTGKVLHSHYYRHPEDFKNKKVLCLGAGPSGVDISIDLSKFAEKVYLAHRHAALATPFPSNLEQTCGVKKVLETGILLEDGSELDVDGMILCTGYKYKFPFLSEECQLSTEGERVTPLFKHVLHTKYPSLSFIGLCKQICPFPQFYCQVLFAIAALDGTMSLPSEEEMLQDTEKDYQKRLAEGMPHRYAHKMGKRQWEYNDELARTAGFKPIPRVYQKLYEFVSQNRKKNVLTYHDFNVKVINSDEFIVC